jgi:hypothetical protein
MTTISGDFSANRDVIDLSDLRRKEIDYSALFVKKEMGFL